MVVVDSERVSQGKQASHEECFSQLPHKLWTDLESTQFSYPGWEKDFQGSQEAFQQGNETKFNRTCRKLRDKQRVYDDYKAFTRLTALASLELSYPGSELDKHTVEEWHLKHPSNDDTDIEFEDKLEGLRNKERLYYGDRTHPHIRDLDSLELSYQGWENDYQAAISVHCDTPGKSFANALHRLRQKEQMSRGDRSHWRLVELDKLNLTYPGWEEDVAEVEDWHVRNADTSKNNILYAEVIEGMKDQQQIFLGWDHEAEETEDDYEDRYAAEVGREREDEVKDFVKCYESITESLNSVEGKKKQLLIERERPTLRSESSLRQQERSPSPTLRTSLLSESRPTEFNQRATTTPTFGEDTLAPPQQANLGKCEVCLVRPRTHVFAPCGHLCACAACSHKAMEETGNCPICRGTADNSFRVFLT